MSNKFLQYFIGILFCLSYFLFPEASSRMNCLRSRALRYCALSNLHDLGKIRPMIDPLNSVVYGNKGVDNIMNGMANFQEKYNDVFWIFGDFKVDNDCVVFDFKRYWTEQDGIYCSSASEVIKFNEKGLVTLIEYINLPSSPTLIGESYPDSRSMNLSEDRRIVEDTDSLYD